MVLNTCPVNILNVFAAACALDAHTGVTQHWTPCGNSVECAGATALPGPGTSVIAV